jgi:hypothetical protein
MNSPLIICEKKCSPDKNRSLAICRSLTSFVLYNYQKLYISLSMSSKKRSTKDYVDLEELPVEIVFKILLYLDVKQISKLCRTSTLINAICNDESFWESYRRIHDIPRVASVSIRENVRSIKSIIARDNRKVDYIVVPPHEIIIRWDSGVPVALTKLQLDNTTLAFKTILKIVFAKGLDLNQSRIEITPDGVMTGVFWFYELPPVTDDLIKQLYSSFIHPKLTKHVTTYPK